MALRPFRILSLFSGGGGLELGLRLAVPGARTVGYVEREAYAAAVLVARMEEKALEPAPVWDDIATFNGHPWRGAVDCVSGGFPCTDISNAGRREGIEGEHSGLWTHFARILGEVRPSYAVVENVSALTVRGLDVVLGDLAALGFDAEGGCVGADDAGAPHQRDRLFILAHCECEGWGRSAWGNIAGLRSLAQQGGARSGERSGSSLGRSEILGRGVDGEVGNAGIARLEELRRRGVPGSEAGGVEPRSAAHGTDRGVVAPFPPGPDDAEGWRRYLEEWPSLEPAVLRSADELAPRMVGRVCLHNRVERLRLLGNGVCPQQAALAFRLLFARLGGD